VLPEKQRDDALAALTSVSLAAHDALPEGAPAISVHRLVQEVMRGRLRKSGRFEDAAALAIRALYQGYDEEADTIAAHYRRAAWLAHAVAAMDHAPRNGKAARQTVGVCIFAGDFRRSRGDLSSALHAYDLGKKIAEAAARSEPDKAQWERDLSVSYERVGDVLVAQGNLPDALKDFRDSLAIAERLAKADPQNAGWQRDLSISHNKVGDVLKDQGNLPDALKAFRDSLAIRERLARADPQTQGGSAISPSPSKRWAVC
jgi:tetratricopeptide (TPR) repeat protein